MIIVCNQYLHRLKHLLGIGVVEAHRKLKDGLAEGGDVIGGPELHGA